MRAPLALLVALLAVPAPAGAEHPCDRVVHPGLSVGPIVIGLGELDLGTPRRACPRTEISLGAVGSAIIDTPDFYGHLAAGGVLSGSYALGKRAEVFAAIEFLRFQFAQNASLKATSLDLGQMTIGGSLVAFARGKWVLTPYVRLMLPTTTATPGVATIGGEVGLAASFRPYTKLEVHAHFGLDMSMGISAAPAYVRSGLDLSLGLQYSPWTWLGLVLDLQSQFGRRADVDFVAPAIAFRFRLYKGLGAELAATLPIAGVDRHLFAGALRFAYRF